MNSTATVDWTGLRSRRIHRSRLRGAQAVTLVVLLSGSACAGAGPGSGPGSNPSDAPPAVELSTSAPASVSDATLSPGEAVPAPAGRVVLVVRGAENANVGNDLRLDLELLDQLDQVEMSVDDPAATGERATFSGPLVRTVMALAGGRGDTIHAVALNDYEIDVPVSDADDLPLLLATRMNGAPMSVANYGPTRFIYPTDGYDLDPATYDPRLIWQLQSLSWR